MVISHKKWKIVFLESLMNFKHERSNSEFFYEFGIALKEFEMKICKNVVFGSIWKKLIFDSFDLREVFLELRKIRAFF